MAAACESGPDSTLHVSSLVELEHGFLRDSGLQQMVRDYYASGADDECTLADNRAQYGRFKLLPRMLRDVSSVDMSVNILGCKLAFPVIVAPMAMQQMAHAEGELAVARAAAAAGTHMIVSTMANYSIEDVAEAAGAQHLWFQLYVFRNRETVRRLVTQAERLGYCALVVTVDAPQLGNREADERNGFRLPEGLTLGNTVYAAPAAASPDRADRSNGAGAATEAGVQSAQEDLKGARASASAEGEATRESQSSIAGVFLKDVDDGLTWDFLKWLAGITRLPILVKGVLHPDDARRAVAAGAAGVIVSNHGGRQLDTAPAPLDVLEACVHAARGAQRSRQRPVVLVDGGIRRGTDVVKALALGADAVCLGRPVLYALARGGEAGVLQALTMLKREARLALALSGCARLADVTPDAVKHERSLPLVGEARMQDQKMSWTLMAQLSFISVLTAVVGRIVKS